MRQPFRVSPEVDSHEAKYFPLCLLGILILLLLTLPLIRSDKSGPTEQFIAVCDTFFADPEAHSIRTGTGEDFTEEFYWACLPLYEHGDYDAIERSEINE